MRFDILSLATEWQSMFLQLLDDTKEHPITAYQPTKQYIQQKSSGHRLNIAAGPNVFPYDGWINYDHETFSSYFDYLKSPQMTDVGMPAAQAAVLHWLQSGGQLDFHAHDMTKPFSQHADNSVEGIYVGQAIEHINPVFHLPAFLKECHRMLKPGGVLRMTTPDLDILLDAYRANEMDRFNDDQPDFYKDACPSMKLALLMYGASGPSCTQTSYEGHMCLFTRTSLSKELSKAGFQDITFYRETGKSKDPVMALQVKDEGVSHSLIVEAVK